MRNNSRTVEKNYNPHRNKYQFRIRWMDYGCIEPLKSDAKTAKTNSSCKKRS
jgi:hypothetical protein